MSINQHIYVTSINKTTVQVTYAVGHNLECRIKNR